MIIKKPHAEMLLTLLNEKNRGEHITVLEESNTETVRTLERAGLVSLDSNLNVTLTYGGAIIANQLKEMIEGNLLKDIKDWDNDWKWIGSEIIAMIDAAIKGDNVTEITYDYLKERGFIEKKNGKYKINNHGKVIFDIYKNITPLLTISHELAEYIRTLPAGPTLSSRLSVGAFHEHLLEAMRLIAYSVPKADVYSFTALGQAVKNTLELGGFVNEGYVISPHILVSLSDFVDGKDIPSSALTLLQTLGYVDSDKNLLPAGEWALEVYRLWKNKPREDIWSFSIEDEEIDVLETIQYLIDNNKPSTFDEIKAELVDRKVKEYSQLIEKYGRRLDEMPEKMRNILKQFQNVEDHIKWFEDNFNLRIALFSLESFNLIETSQKDNKEIFLLTKYGKEVLNDQKRHKREISSVAVKAITMTRKSFSAPQIEWYEKAREEGLIGNYEPTKSGYFYAYIAENIERKPYLTKYEHEIFKMIPDKGVSVKDIMNRATTEEEKRNLQWALEKLEARHLIEILPDGNIIETEAGKLMDRALSGVPSGFGTPITPVMYRVIEALVKVGSLYEKEKKIRVLPRKLKEAVKLSGLSDDTFGEALLVCKKAGFVGNNSVNETGLLLIEAVKLMNPLTSLEGYADIYEFKKDRVK